ncbi:MAG: T9SS type A sorting domain-containing protein [Cyclonatronaceae bacterium]
MGPHYESYNAYDMVTLDANLDELSEIAAAWFVNSSIEVTLLKADPKKLAVPIQPDPSENWETATTYKVDTPDYFQYLEDSPPDAIIPWLANAPLLTSGDYNGDGRDELVLAYMYGNYSDTLKLRLAHLNIGDSLEVTERIPVMEQDMVLNHDPSLRGGKDPRVDVGKRQPLRLFELTSGDFNGDGKDEILLVGREAAGTGYGWNLFASVYSFETSDDRWEQNMHEVIYSRPDTDSNERYEILGFSMGVGKLNDVSSHQAVIGFTQFFDEGWLHTAEPYLFALSFNASLTGFTSSVPVFVGSGNTNRDYTANSLNIADINGDGLEEIVSLAGSGSVSIYQLNEALELNLFAQAEGAGGYGPFAVGDVIADTADTRNIPELIVAGTMYEFAINEDGSYEGVTAAGSYEGGYGWWFPNGLQPYDYSSGMLTAELEGDIWLGTPKRSSITKILQPMVILNAPPIHFDIIDGNIYDLNKMYGDSQGSFKSSYEINSEEQTEVQTEFNKDWGLSGSLSGGGKLFGSSVKAHLKGTYGEKFSEKGESSTTIKVNISVDAIEDDRIYATVVDYDVWEYPVYGNGVEQGHVLVVDPVITENRWFPSKSWSGNSYVPDHEVGNILSYREYATLSENPAVDENGFIKGDHNTSFVLDGNSSYAWSLEFEDFEASETTTQKEFGMEWGASIKKWGVKASINGHYSSEEINTQRTSVSEGLFLGVELDALNTGLGEVAYRVTPYAYWADNGALVIDYAVQPELAEQGFTNTWWQDHYSDHADPGFILPWRYDPEKGFELQDPSKRSQTKDIIFFPVDPAEGDLVTITARIHNLSLLPTDYPVGVSFYLGDPDEGGRLIEGKGGAAVVYTDTAIPARGKKAAEMQWRIPADVGTFPRIYGLIDPENTMDEIHAGNNKGWNVLGKTTPVGVEEETMAGVQDAFQLHQNYPNPFNPGTTIEFSMPQPGMVTLTVYNILGQRVTTLASGRLDAGTHSRYWDATGLASGVYLYRLSAPEYTRTRAMVLVK